MIVALTLCLLAAPQDPVTPDVDVIRLQIGTEITGRIVTETDDYVEVEIGPGTVVGFGKDRVVSISRAVKRAEPQPEPELEPEADGPYRLRDEWNVLHDSEGRAIGWMHATVTPAEDGGVRIGEEWRFAGDGRTVETTVLEVVDADGRPVSAFCHERIRSADDRLSGDRVVRAVVEGDQLAVSVRTPRGAERRSYDFAPGTRFPLELRAELRQRPAGVQAQETHTVFDPLTEQFEKRTYDFGRTRRVDLGEGEALPVRVLTASGTRGENTEWLDASARPVRSEIAGPALVAVPVANEAQAKSRAAEASVAFPPSFQAELNGAFGLWLPSPAWRFVETDRPDEITAEAPVDDATMSLVRLGHLDADLELPSATDAVLRWLRLVHKRLMVVERGEQSIRATVAARVRARATRHDSSEVELLIHVLQIDGQWFAACGSAPRTAFARIEPELEWMVERLELQREGFAPELRGPLAKRHGKRR